MAGNSFSKNFINHVFELKSYYNIPLWLNSSNDQKISEFYLETPQVIEFFFEKKEKKVLNDYFKRYGSDQYVLMKIFQLLGGSSPMRKAKMSYENDNQTKESYTAQSEQLKSWIE